MEETTEITTTAVVVRPPRGPLGGLARWAATDCRPGSVVLSIGAGENWSGSLRPLLRREPYVVGVDPDAAIERNRSLAERHRTTLEEYASEAEGRFDLAIAIYVLEHVADPAAFTTACARVLKPGGTLFALTPNVEHYFGATTWALSRLGVADRLLEQLHGHDDGHHHHHEHFRTEYRLNSMRRLARHLGASGFREVEFRCFDDTARYAWYLPKGVGWFAPAWSRLAYAVGSPHLMGHLSFRAVR
ncbi:class I SAM-dependent methyltransferase [Nocardioides euryhalodurans]|uniref:class I SAM-dependent methyltransferase n=1 Tax=Nocardioides euryhalodurans TaxID=2518370 RepID=UPI00142229B2|nr:methyltransferase domain-containing protein [Nocardioides euryhalodurans]